MVADFPPDFSIYLASSTYIDSEHPAVRAKAAALAAGAVGDAATFGWCTVSMRAATSPASLPQEQLAFPVLAPEERDLPEIWPAPLAQVVASLTSYATVQDVAAHLPDIELLPLQK